MVAIIKETHYEKGKSISSKSSSQVAMEYNWDDEFFGIWAYRNGDLNREHGPKQKLQFNKQVAKEIYNALGKFLSK